MFFKSLKLPILLTSVLLIQACGVTHEKFSDDSPQLVATPDTVTAMLATAADRASTALETLAAVEYARTPTPEVAPVVGAPSELQRAVTVAWVGPAENILKRLADRASYNFVTVGNPPPIPLVVNVDATNKPVIEVFRSVGLQLGNRAVVRVEADQKLIELQYPSSTGVGEFY